MLNKTKTKTTFRLGKLKVVCEPQVREVDGKWYSDAYVYSGTRHSACFFTALDTGELSLGEVQLSQTEHNWLCSIEEQVCEALEALDNNN